jgi:hypothetical protein
LQKSILILIVCFLHLSLSEGWQLASRQIGSRVFAQKDLIHAPSAGRQQARYATGRNGLFDFGVLSEELPRVDLSSIRKDADTALRTIRSFPDFIFAATFYAENGRWIWKSGWSAVHDRYPR